MLNKSELKIVEVYQISNGDYYENLELAHAAQDDLIGEALDGLLKLFELDIPRNQEFKSLMCVMSKRDELKKAIIPLLHHLTYHDAVEDKDQDL